MSFLLSPNFFSLYEITIPSVLRLILAFGFLISGIFGKITFSKFPDLRAVNISKCAIKHLSCDTFSPLRRLEALTIDQSTVNVEVSTTAHNRLPLPYFDELNFENSTVTGLSKNVLYDFSALRSLRFDYSNITNISSNVFDDLSSITRLQIRSSRVRNFDFALISKIDSLQYLALHNLETDTQIDYNVFSSLPNLERVLFDMNVYEELNFESFSSLRSVDIVRDDRKQSSIAVFNSATRYLKQKGIQYNVIRRWY